MTKSVVFKFYIGIAFILGIAPTAWAQLSPDSAMGINAGFARLFGTIPGFNATADVQLLDASRQESVRTPMRFAFAKGKLRMDIDMTQMKGKSVPPELVNSFKRASLERITSIVRPDQKTICLIFSGVRSYANVEMPKAESAVTEKNVQILKTPQGRETIDGHDCTRNKVVLKGAKGSTLLEAITWNAADMKDFPVQIQLPSADKTTIVRFTQVQMIVPDSSQFEPPTGFKKYPTPDSLLISIAHQYENSRPAPAAAPTRKAASPAPAKSPEKKSAATKAK